jgi:hypothetical protein
MATKIPNCRKIDQMAIKIYQHLPMQDSPEFNHFGIFGLKICHLATLVCNEHSDTETKSLSLTLQ